MKFSDYKNNHHVFTTPELYNAVDSDVSAEEQLRLAVKSGVVERVRRGLLVFNSGRYENTSVEQTEIISTLDANAVISYHSALEAHGVAHNIGFVCYFRSDTTRSEFEFRGILYKPSGPVRDVQSKRLRTSSGYYLATTKEQTIIDCLDKPAFSGGIEEAVRSISAFVYLDIETLVKLAIKKGPSMVSRVGWLLSVKRDDWHVEERYLFQLEGHLGRGPYRLLSSSRESLGWSSRWKLIFSERNEDVESWITRL